MALSNASGSEQRGIAAAILAAVMAIGFGCGEVVAAAETPREQVPAATNALDASNQDLSSLLRGMRSAPGVIAQFSETKELALLSGPLESTGTIYFIPPDRLVRVVTTPGRSRLVVDGDKVRFEDDNGRKALDLSASPMARQLIDSFIVLFSGNEERLKELYRTEFSADGKTWRLKLLPRSAPLDRMISSFDLSGTAARIDRMEAVEPDGDRTVTRFGETDAQHTFSTSELETLFAEGPES